LKDVLIFAMCFIFVAIVLLTLKLLYLIVSEIVDDILNLLSALFKFLFSPGSTPPKPPRAPPPASPPPPAPPLPYAPGPSARYVSDWQSIAKNVKEAANWRCGQCHLSLISDRELLHVHHRDRDTTNNSRANLQVLCVQCHSLEEGAGHKRLAGAIKTDGRLQRILILRRNQTR
jgi:hypothetical protein